MWGANIGPMQVAVYCGKVKSRALQVGAVDGCVVFRLLFSLTHSLALTRFC